MVGRQYVAAARWRRSERGLRRKLHRHIAAAPRRLNGLLSSYQRSGRLMTRFALVEYLRQAFELDEPLEFGTHTRFIPNLLPYRADRGLAEFAYASQPQIPLLACSHSAYYPAIHGDLAVVLILRDPRDVLVSYHRWVTRSQGEWEGSFHEFIRRRAVGVPRLSRYLETWSRAPRATVVTYEGWTADPPQGLERVLRGFGLEVDSEMARVACDRASFARMRALETAAREMPEPPDPDRLHVRRGVRGGWRSELSPEEITDLSALLDGALTDRGRELLRAAGLASQFGEEARETG